MRLYFSPLSPFAARVRIALHHKGVPCELVPPPAAGLKSAEYLALNPLGKVPLLVLDDGTCIPESETILDYLEDAYPDDALRPAHPVQRARMRTAIRVTDNYVTPPTARLFAHLDPSSRDARVVESELRLLADGLRYLTHYVPDATYILATLTLADCCVFPSLFLARLIGQQFGVDDVLAGQTTLPRYIDKARADTSIGYVHEEMTAALAQYMKA